ncbi:mechanosensitive ion channel family protein [Haloarchaeobius sp. HRN-SO-5]|uniref:mechanosensitive ion channel family protein n=1 Tax=Haloarchaeobius sp. HRN-SO-5 TaxID=3446118 RepID=UPI003EC123B0
MVLDAAVVVQTTPPPPGVEPEELVGYWSLVVRLAWFFAAFLVVALLGWYVVEPVVGRIVRTRNRNNRTVQEAMTRYVRLLVLLVAVLAGMSTAGYGRFLQSSALIVAAATLALGVAAQTVVGSLVSGLVLVADPEFNVGDYIEWDDGEGTVRSITLRVTRVQTPDGALVTIPNTHLTSQSVTRPFGHGRARIVDRVSIAYEDDVDEALFHLREAADAVDGIAESPSPTVHVEEFGGDAVVLRSDYWLTEPDPGEAVFVRSAYARQVKTRLEGAGITISPASKRDLSGRVAVDESA